MITITDDGAGIAPDLLPHVFDLFVQSARTLDRSQGGLGIGLSVVKRLVEMHGGRVVARERRRRPRRDVRDSPAAARGRRSSCRRGAAPDERAEPHSHRRRQSRRRRFARDDAGARGPRGASDVRGRSPRSRVCANSGRTSCCSTSGCPAWTATKSPGASASNPKARRVRLIALTGYGQESDKSRTRAAGFDEHLVKPVELRTLHQALAVRATRH